ncbi:MAG: protein kinase [Candidatus Brocadiae bacterium]|nr:protein kinase [Candidatus Brocadiia bacterium]
MDFINKNKRVNFEEWKKFIKNQGCSDETKERLEEIVNKIDQYCEQYSPYLLPIESIPKDKLEKLQGYIVSSKEIKEKPKDSVEFEEFEESEEFEEKKEFDIELCGLVGSGVSAYVFLAFEKKNARFVCLKLMERSRVSGILKLVSLDVATAAKREKEIGKIFHDNIPRIYDKMDDKIDVIIQLEYIPGVTLDKCFDKIKNCSFSEKIKILKQVTEAIKTIHLHKFLHLDIHPRNIIIDILGTKKASVIDFGMSKKIDIDNLATNHEGKSKYYLSPKRGIPPYLAPEIQKPPGSELSEAIDIWNLGVLCCELLSGEQLEENFILKNISFPCNCSQDIKELVLYCVNYDPRNRPSAAELYEEFKFYYQLEMYPQRQNYLHLITRIQNLINNSSAESQIKKITVDTLDGEASIYVQEDIDKGKLLRSKWRERKGRAALQELSDEMTVITSIKEPVKIDWLPTQDSEFKSFNIEAFFANLIKDNDHRKRNSEKIRDLVLNCLIQDQKKEIVCYKCGKRWQLEHLEWGVHVFLYGEKRQCLKPCCQKCILKDNRDTRNRPQLNPNLYDKIAYIYGTVFVKFYYHFSRGRVHVLYLCPRPSGFTNNQWGLMLERIKRGYGILRDYPSSYFISVCASGERSTRDKQYALLTTNYFPGIALAQILDSQTELTMTQSIIILLDLAKALNSLHVQGIVHRNINHFSIFLGVNGQIKLGDFSLCKFEDNDGLTMMEPNVGFMSEVIQYISPEIIDNGMASATTASDIWSWGIVAYLLFSNSRTLPFSNKNKILECKADFAHLQNFKAKFCDSFLEKFSPKFTELCKTNPNSQINNLGKKMDQISDNMKNLLRNIKRESQDHRLEDLAENFIQLMKNSLTWDKQNPDQPQRPKANEIIVVLEKIISVIHSC